jgi:ADP-L-glycero-D-manno-heptose 6-epimerase
MFVVTGGAGFIGSNMVAALDARWPGRVAVCDRLADGDKWRNLAKRELAAQVTPDELFDFLGDNRTHVRAVVHMGAISSTTETDVDSILAANYRLPLAMWRWCTDNQVALLYASSAATYGDGSAGFDDDASPRALDRLRPLNPYGWSKHLFDRLVARMVADNRPRPPQWAGLKFFNVYGPNEYHKGAQRSVVAQMVPPARRGEAVRLFESHHPDYPDGGQMRDFVFVDDCVAMMMWLLDNQAVSGLFNCGTGRARTFADLARAVFAALGLEPRIEFVPTPEQLRERYQYFTQAEMGRVRAAGYEPPFTELEDGVACYVRDFLLADDMYR